MPTAESSSTKVSQDYRQQEHEKEKQIQRQQAQTQTQTQKFIVETETVVAPITNLPLNNNANANNISNNSKNNAIDSSNNGGTGNLISNNTGFTHPATTVASQSISIDEHIGDPAASITNQRGPLSDGGSFDAGQKLEAPLSNVPASVSTESTDGSELGFDGTEVKRGFQTRSTLLHGPGTGVPKRLSNIEVDLQAGTTATTNLIDNNPLSTHTNQSGVLKNKKSSLLVDKSELESQNAIESLGPSDVLKGTNSGSITDLRGFSRIPSLVGLPRIGSSKAIDTTSFALTDTTEDDGDNYSGSLTLGANLMSDKRANKILDRTPANGKNSRDVLLTSGSSITSVASGDDDTSNATITKDMSSSTIPKLASSSPKTGEVTDQSRIPNSYRTGDETNNDTPSEQQPSNGMAIVRTDIDKVTTPSDAADVPLSSSISKSKKTSEVSKKFRHLTSESHSQSDDTSQKPTKTEIFAAKLASAVDENEISDSEETFVYESAANSVKNSILPNSASSVTMNAGLPGMAAAHVPQHVPNSDLQPSQYGIPSKASVPLLGSNKNFRNRLKSSRHISTGGILNHNNAVDTNVQTSPRIPAYRSMVPPLGVHNVNYTTSTVATTAITGPLKAGGGLKSNLNTATNPDNLITSSDLLQPHTPRLGVSSDDFSSLRSYSTRKKYSDGRSVRSYMLEGHGSPEKKGSTTSLYKQQQQQQQNYEQALDSYPMQVPLGRQIPQSVSLSRRSVSMRQPNARSSRRAAGASTMYAGQQQRSANRQDFSHRKELRTTVSKIFDTNETPLRIYSGLSDNINLEDYIEQANAGFSVENATIHNHPTVLAGAPSFSEREFHSNDLVEDGNVVNNTDGWQFGRSVSNYTTNRSIGRLRMEPNDLRGGHHITTHPVDQRSGHHIGEGIVRGTNTNIVNRSADRVGKANNDTNNYNDNDNDNDGNENENEGNDNTTGNRDRNTNAGTITASTFMIPHYPNLGILPSHRVKRSMNELDNYNADRINDPYYLYGPTGVVREEDQEFSDDITHGAQFPHSRVSPSVTPGRVSRGSIVGAIRGATVTRKGVAERRERLAANGVVTSATNTDNNVGEEAADDDHSVFYYSHRSELEARPEISDYEDEEDDVDIGCDELENQKYYLGSGGADGNSSQPVLGPQQLQPPRLATYRVPSRVMNGPSSGYFDCIGQPIQQLPMLPEDEQTSLLQSSQEQQEYLRRRISSNHFDYSPHNFSGKKSNWSRFQNFVYLTFVTVILLTTGFVFGFFLATNKELQNFQVVAIDNVISAKDELLLDLTASAFNPSFFSITMNECSLDIFARSDWVPEDGDELQVRETTETILLGVISRFDTNLEFHGGFFNRKYDMSRTSLKLLNPGNPVGTGGEDGDDIDNSGGTHDVAENESNDTHRYGNSDEEKDSPPVKVSDLDGTQKWQEILKHDYDLILRGVVKYRIPIFRSEKTLAVQYTTRINNDSGLTP